MQTYLIDFRVLLTIAAMMNSPAIQMTIRREAAEPTTLQEGECEAEANRHAGGRSSALPPAGCKHNAQHQQLACSPRH